MIQAAIDTSCGAALAIQVDGEIAYSGGLAARGRRSDAELVPWILAAIDSAGLTLGAVRRWTVGTGPGSFSGVRVGISLVKGICAGSRAAGRGLPSSLALARSAAGGVGMGERIAVLHDARRGQVIVSMYQVAPSGLCLESAPVILDPAELADAPAFACCVTAQAEELVSLLDEETRARLVARSGVDATLLLDPPGWPWPESLGEADASAEPIYVRPAVFVQPREARVIPGDALEKR